MNCPSCSDEMKAIGFEPRLNFGEDTVMKARTYLSCLKCKIYQIVELDEAKSE